MDGWTVHIEGGKWGGSRAVKGHGWDPGKDGRDALDLNLACKYLERRRDITFSILDFFGKHNLW
jgi:hypothetical protein